MKLKQKNHQLQQTSNQPFFLSQLTETKTIGYSRTCLSQHLIIV